jgi:hypothetical protein
MVGWSDWLGGIFLMLLFAIIFNLLIGNVCHGEGLPQMGTELVLTYRFTSEYANKVHGMNQIKVKGMDVGSRSIPMEYFGGDPNGKFSNLPSLFASSDKPRVEKSDSRSDNGPDGCGNTSNGGSSSHINIHLWLLILVPFGVGFTVSMVVSNLILIFPQR